MNLAEAIAQWQADQPHLAARGVVMPEVRTYIPDGFAHNYGMAMDAQPSLFTDANSGIPAFLTTVVDPKVFRILFTPTKAAEILGEQKKGTWLDDTIMFPVVEHTGEVSGYGDYATSGMVNANMNWPQRQSYLFQAIEEFGDREIERAGLGRINLVAEKDAAAADIMQRFLNVTYFFGVAGLQNYGLLNDPNLSASLTPSTKAAGGTRWITTGGVINATANEVYADVQALFAQLITQTGGLVESTDKLVLALSPAAHVALTTTNSFGISVGDLLKKNFPNLRIVTAVQYGQSSASNPNGVAAGNYMQLIAESVGGQEVGYSAFSEKMRALPIVRALSSWSKKLVGGSWGTILRFPAGVASMVGI